MHWHLDTSAYPHAVKLTTFCMSRRRRKMYCGHAHLCVCVCLGGAFSTLLRQSGLRASTGGILTIKSERKMLASTCLYSLYAWLLASVTFFNVLFLIFVKLKKSCFNIFIFIWTFFFTSVVSSGINSGGSGIKVLSWLAAVSPVYMCVVSCCGSSRSEWVVECGCINDKRALADIVVHQSNSTAAS